MATENGLASPRRWDKEKSMGAHARTTKRGKALSASLRDGLVTFNDCLSASALATSDHGMEICMAPLGACHYRMHFRLNSARRSNHTCLDNPILRISIRTLRAIRTYLRGARQCNTIKTCRRVTGQLDGASASNSSSSMTWNGGLAGPKCRMLREANLDLVQAFGIRSLACRRSIHQKDSAQCATPFLLLCPASTSLTKASPGLLEESETVQSLHWHLRCGIAVEINGAQSD